MIGRIQQAVITDLVSPRKVWIEMGDWTGIVDCNPDYMPRAVGDTCWVRIDDAFPGPPHISVLDKVRPDDRPATRGSRNPQHDALRKYSTGLGATDVR